MEFGNPIIGEEELIRSAIKSRDYEAGVSGWRIAQDGAAEFNDLVVRGEVHIVNGDDSIDFVNSPHPLIEFNTSDPNEIDNAELGFTAIGAESIWFKGPNFGAGADYLMFDATNSASSQRTLLQFWGDLDMVSGDGSPSLRLQNSDGRILMNAGTGNDIVITGRTSISSQAFGNVVITPVADTPTSATVTGLSVSGTSFYGYATANTSALGVVREVSVSNVTSSGLMVWIYSIGSTTNRTVNWQVMGI